MTPFSARLTLVSFLLLAGAIATNALYLQAPLETNSRVTSSVTEPAKPDEAERISPTPRAERNQPRQAAPKGDLQAGRSGSTNNPPRDNEVRSAPAPENPSEPDADPVPLPPEEVIRAIQRELAFRNYAVGRRDGRLDTATRLAILNYQYDAGLRLTGRPSEAVLKDILFGPFQGAASDRRIAQFEADSALVARVQRVLSRLGFGNLAENGRLGAETRAAVREFAAFRDLPRDGRLSPRLLLELVEITDERLARGGARSAGELDGGR
jgi:peptidoglycan hydrolase-like protein with peptidoglycan-binding domain